MKKRRHRNHRNIPFEVFNYFNHCKNLQETAHRFNMSEDAVLSIVNSYSDDHIIIANKKETAAETAAETVIETMTEQTDKAIDSVEELIKNLHTNTAIYSAHALEPQCGIWCKVKRFFKKILFLS